MAKSKSSSRTSSSKKNNLKLKWWYVLPVILVVAIAGYAIVRFSEASVGTAYKKVGTELNCTDGGGEKVNKGGTLGVSCLLRNPGKYASATWSMHVQGTNTIRCATVYFGTGSMAAIRYKATGSPFGAYDFTTNWENWSGNNVTKPICTPSMSNLDRGKWEFTKNVTLEVKNVGGAVSVVDMYLTQ